MQVDRVATMAIAYCAPYDTVSELSERMAQSEVGLLPVVEEEGKTIGVVTDRDIVTRCLGRGLNPKTTYAKDIMSTPAHWIYVDAEVDDAVRLMGDRRVRRLLIKDHRDQPVGILSLDDLAIFTHGDPTVGRIMEQTALDTTAASRVGFYDAVV